MLAGETWVTLAAVRRSTKFSETLEDAAPMTTEASSWISLRAEAVLMDRSVVSPESSIWWHAWAPLTPPAALMSETAMPTPATSGGPRNARLPVSGRMPPALNVSAFEEPSAHSSLVNSSSAGAAESLDSLVGSVSVASGSESSEPQAVSTRPSAAVPAMSLTQWDVVDRFTW